MSAKLRLLPLYLLLITTLGQAGLEKLIGGAVPEWFLKQFTGSLLDVFPGALAASFYLIALLELASALILILSLLKREHLPGRNKSLLNAGLLLSQLTFVSLAFGQRITHQFEGAFMLFAYATLTFLAAQLVLREKTT